MAKTQKTDQPTLIVQRRETIGSSRTRRLRKTGVIPAIVYGHEVKPMAITIDAKAFVKVLHSKAGEHALVRLRVTGGTPWEKPALVKAVQHDPVYGHVLHVDFHAIALTEKIRVEIPVVLRGEPVGVKEEAGVLEHFLRQVEVECLPTEIPEHIEMNVEAMNIGDTLHVRDLPVPKNAKMMTDPEGAVAAVQAPKEEKPEEEAAEATTEPEVIGEKQVEGEEAVEGAKGEAKEEGKEGGSKLKETGEKKDAK